MARWVNFTEVRERVSIEQVLLQYYQFDNLTKHGDKITGPCPVHGGSSPRAFHADLSRNVWHCFSKCQGGGNQLDLVAKREDISIREAALRLQEFFLGGGETSTGPPERPPRRAPTSSTNSGSQEGKKPMSCRENPVLELRLTLAHDHPHLLKDRGFALGTCQHFDVGYCRRGMMRGCIAIPIKNIQGEVVAYAGRRLKPQDARKFGKYKLPKGFRKELVLYNHDQAQQHANERGLILVEGFFTVLALYEAGFENVVACMGSELSISQVQQLTTASEVLILFDGDEAGRRGAATAREKLEQHTVVRIAILPDGVSPDDLCSRTLKWLIQGMQILDLSDLSFAMRPKS